MSIINKQVYGLDRKVHGNAVLFTTNMIFINIVVVLFTVLQK